MSGSLEHSSKGCLFRAMSFPGKIGIYDTIGNAHIPFKQSVNNLCFTLDCHLTINAHVSNIARTCYFEQRRLASIRRLLTSTATATLPLEHCDHVVRMSVSRYRG